MGWNIQLPIPELVSTPERMLQVCRQIKDTGICALDTETTGLNIIKDIILFWSLCPDLQTRFCLTRDMLPIFEQEIARNPDIVWIMTNANYDNNILANCGVPLMEGPIHCTLVMDWLHDENRLGRHGLKETALDHLGLNMRQFKSVFKKAGKETYQDTLLRMWDQEQENAIDYASMDAWASLAVWKHLKKKLIDEQTIEGITLWDIFVNIEAPFTKVLYNCIRNGVKINVDYLEERKVPIDKDLKILARKINKIVGREINPLSPTDLQKVFFEELRYKPIKFTSGGQSGNRKPSLDVGVLKAFSEQGDKLSNLILDYRGLVKTKSTYIDGMINKCDNNHRIHPTLTQHVAVTGRLSSVNPNLQNIKHPDDDEYQLRGGFIPAPGYKMVACDYKQIEMRILAVLAKDEKMQEVIRNGWDIHMGTASIMYGIPYEKIVEAKKIAGGLERKKVPRTEWPDWVVEYVGYRRTSKTIGFGVNYEQGDMALAAKLGVSVEEARKRKRIYFDQYLSVEKFIEKTHQQCRYLLEVLTILGRKRRLRDSDADWRDAYFNRKIGEWIPERPGPLAARALRQGGNSRIQGSAADIVKLAQIRCMEDSKLEELGVRQILQVHDEILFEVPTENLKEGCERIKTITESPFYDLPERLGLNFRKLPIPLDVDIGHGESWMEAH
jgi:DNA polymerase-1